jgi:hypothetical protein
VLVLLVKAPSYPTNPWTGGRGKVDPLSAPSLRRRGQPKAMPSSSEFSIRRPHPCRAKWVLNPTGAVKSLTRSWEFDVYAVDGNSNTVVDRGRE